MPTESIVVGQVTGCHQLHQPAMPTYFEEDLPQLAADTKHFSTVCDFALLPFTTLSLCCLQYTMLVRTVLAGTISALANTHTILGPQARTILQL